jgi:AcrR family transcriptional regulator
MKRHRGGPQAVKNELEVRNILIRNTVRLVAEGGFEKATTKAITFCGDNLPGMKMNEVYIYRLFGSKEHLYETAFEMLDTELVVALRTHLAHSRAGNMPTKDKMHYVFIHTWRFILQNEERCRFYTRYYYSIYFRGESLAKHARLFEQIIDSFSPLFREGADVGSIMHIILSMLLDFAIRVYNGDLEDNETNRAHIFNVLYCVMASYFNDRIAKETNATSFIEGR